MALASLDELQARLEWTLDPDDTRAAYGALEELSEQAMYYGRSAWDESTVPRLVRNTILAAAARFMRNPDGYTTSRAGDETLSWAERNPNLGIATFTDVEIRMVRSLAGHTGLTSAPVTAWGTKIGGVVGYVPVVNSLEKPFPFFADNDATL